MTRRARPPEDAQAAAARAGQRKEAVVLMVTQRSEQRDEQRSAQRDEQVVGPFIERFASVLVEAGVPPMPARVFSALLVTDAGRLTAAELTELLGASAAAISGAVRYLEQVGMISRQREPGSRRDVYLLRNDLWYEISLGRDQVLAHWANAARDGAEILGPDTPAGQRLADSHDFFVFLRQELPALLERWRAHKAQHG
jgi:predicted transcriptional regulator